MSGRTAKFLLRLCVVSIAAVMLAWASSYGTSLITAHDGRLVVLVAPDIDGHRHLRRLEKDHDAHETIVEVLSWSKPNWQQFGFDYRSFNKPTEYNATRREFDTVVVKVVSVPFWAVALLPLAPIVALAAYLRFRRRSAVGTCPHCGYDLRGITRATAAPSVAGSFPTANPPSRPPPNAAGRIDPFRSHA